jgi:hypothetical protein
MAEAFKTLPCITTLQLIEKDGGRGNRRPGQNLKVVVATTSSPHLKILSVRVHGKISNLLVLTGPIANKDADASGAIALGFGWTAA